MLKNFIPTWGTLLDLYSDQQIHFTGKMFQKVCVVWPGLQHFHCAYYSQASGLVKCTNGIIKIQLANFVEFFQMPWPKALLLVLLNLRSTPFGAYKLHFLR